MLIIKKMIRKDKIPYLVVENMELGGVVEIPLDLLTADRINKYLSKIIFIPSLTEQQEEDDKNTTDSIDNITD